MRSAAASAYSSDASEKRLRLWLRQRVRQTEQYARALRKRNTAPAHAHAYAKLTWRRKDEEGKARKMQAERKRTAATPPFLFFLAWQRRNCASQFLARPLRFLPSFSI